MFFPQSKTRFTPMQNSWHISFFFCPDLKPYIRTKFV